MLMRDLWGVQVSRIGKANANTKNGPAFPMRGAVCHLRITCDRAQRSALR